MKIFIITILFLFLFSACHQQQVDNELIRSGPDLKVPIVLYFKKGTTNDEINFFLDNVVGKSRPDGRGHDLLEGMQGTFSVRTQDYEGYAIELRKNITQEERESILKAINSSPLIYKVFENVIPKEIVLDLIKAKKEKEDLETLKSDNRPKKSANK